MIASESSSYKDVDLLIKPTFSSFFSVSFRSSSFPGRSNKYDIQHLESAKYEKKLGKNILKGKIKKISDAGSGLELIIRNTFRDHSREQQGPETTLRRLLPFVHFVNCEPELQTEINNASVTLVLKM